jgi:hypothetical protein
VNEGGALGKVEFMINLRDQGIEGRILSFGIALGFLLFSEATAVFPQRFLFLLDLISLQFLYYKEDRPGSRGSSSPRAGVFL